jgi:RNA polymerase sigma-70 factor (ECF subfamily)
MRLTDAVAAPLTSTRFPPDFKAIFANHFDYVWFSLRRLGIPDRDLEDVTHEVFIRVHRLLETYEPEKPIRPWLFAFAYRKASDYRNLARHRVEVFSEYAELEDASLTPADALLEREAIDLAEEALDELDVDRRAVFLLHELDGCTVPQISETLQIPLNTAYSRLRLAREQLAKVLIRLRSRRGER